MKITCKKTNREQIGDIARSAIEDCIKSRFDVNDFFAMDEEARQFANQITNSRYCFCSTY